MKYTLIKDETIRRIERVQYVVEIPKNIKNPEKEKYNHLYFIQSIIFHPPYFQL